jgi:hypothetical protein
LLHRGDPDRQFATWLQPRRRESSSGETRASPSRDGAAHAHWRNSPITRAHQSDLNQAHRREVHDLTYQEQQLQQELDRVVAERQGLRASRMKRANHSGMKRAIGMMTNRPIDDQRTIVIFAVNLFIVTLFRMNTRFRHKKNFDSLNRQEE